MTFFVLDYLYQNIRKDPHQCDNFYLISQKTEHLKKQDRNNL